MNSLTRLVGYSVLLLLLFLGAALAAQGWLHHQSQELRAEAIDAKRAQFIAATKAVAPPDLHWGSANEQTLGTLVGGTVTIYSEAVPAAPREPAVLYFDQVLVGATPLPVITARVNFTTAPITRLIALQQRVVVGLALLAAFLLGLWFILVALVWKRPGGDAASHSPWTTAKAEMSGLTQLARTS
ncbi:MAG: hypothetical protein ABUL68_01705, partial [Pseudomonadota bacterium]